MNKKTAAQQSTEIKRNVYGMLGLVFIIFILLLFVLQYQNYERQQRNELANEYHLAISEKSTQLLLVIDSSLLWLHSNSHTDNRHLDSSHTQPAFSVRGESSLRDQISSLRAEISRLSKEIERIQKNYNDHEFDTISTILRETVKKVLIDLEDFNLSNKYLYDEIYNIVSPLIAVSHQLQRLHKFSYQKIYTSIEDEQTVARFQIIFIVVILLIIGFFGVIKMLFHVRYVLNELTMAQTKIERVKARFEAMFESIPDAIIFANSDRKIQLINSSATQLFGYTSKELENVETKVLYESYETFLQQGKERFNQSAKSNSEPYEVTYKRYDGSVFPGETLGTSVITKNGELLGYLGIIRDITERKKSEAELEKYRHELEMLVNERTADMKQALEKARKASAAKSEFLSNMSHELRTPMNAILGFAQLLEMNSEGFSETQRANITEILVAGYHLLTLINDVLDLSKIESGKLEISVEDVQFDDVLKQCIRLVTTQAAARQIEIIDRISGHGYSVRADFTRLIQVMLNLLSNAVKYNAERGSITLDCHVTPEGFLHVSVTDTGAGLTETEITKLFVSFERLNVVDNVEGTGIGLVITKHLIELMDGNIGVVSVPGEGSTFWYEVKLSE